MGERVHPVDVKNKVSLVCFTSLRFTLLYFALVYFTLLYFALLYSHCARYSCLVLFTIL